MRKNTLLIFSLLILGACVNKSESFTAVVASVNMGSLIVMVDEDQDEFKSSDVISVSLNFKNKGSSLLFNEGDHVKINYNGLILESYPAQINEVYAIEKIK